MRSIIAALCVSTVLGVTTTTTAPTRKVTPAPINPQQVKCAQPPKGCPSQAKEQSCINWNGCMWVTNSCYYDATCETTKATVIPTHAPVPTVPTIPHPTTKKPTPAPSKCTQIPLSGNCFDMKSETTCVVYPCCSWNAVAKPQRCQYQDLPTAHPTTPTTPKPTTPVVCMAYSTAATCKAESSCSWCKTCKSHKCRNASG